MSEKIGHPSWRGSSTLKSDLILTLAPLCFSPCIIRESNRDARVAAEQAWIIDGSRFPQLIVFGILLPVVAIIPAWAQDNYEIQVYGSDLVAPDHTMVELHSNFTVEGSKATIDGVLPTNHAEHEAVEITQGVNDWFETGFYIFTSIQSDGGWQWVGDHIRLRFRIPESWHWPLGVSLSNEIGYQRPEFSADTWTWEIRPIVDKKIGRWYLSFNPTLDRSFHGPGVNQGVVFSPNFKFSYDITKRIAGGLEYYGSWGPITDFSPLPRSATAVFSCH